MSLKKILFACVLLAFATANLQSQSINSAIVPMYAKGNPGDSLNKARVPLFIWAEITGLTASSTYRYGVRAVKEGQDGATSRGAANQLFLHQSSSNTYTTSYSMSKSGQHDSFTTDANGKYAGWFGLELTGNARFTDGNYCKVRILLNDGAGGTSETHYLTTSDSIKCLDFSTTSGSGCTGVFSHSLATDKNFAFLYDNTTGSGRPLSIALIEQDGFDYRNNKTAATFYKNNVDSISGAWGTVIPNDLANGVRRIENHKLSDGTLFHANTDADGIWTTGSVSTVNQTGGATAIQISVTDAPLIPTNPVVSFANASAQVNENGTSVTVDVTLSNPDANATSVDVVVTGGTATGGSDYTYSTTTVTFPASSTATQTVTINITDDAAVEGTETIILGLQNATNSATVGTISAETVTIVDNDAPSVSFDKTSATVNENAGTISLDVNILNPDPTKATTVEVVVSGGTATSGSDYSYSTATLTFPAGSSAKQTATLTIIDDTLVEGSELLIFMLQNANNSAGYVNAYDTLTITDNDFNPPALSFSVDTSSVLEGATVTILVNITGPLATATTIEVVLGTGSTAVAGADYTFSSTILTFPAGSSASQNVSIPTLTNNMVQTNKTLVLKLQNPTNKGTIGKAQHTLTIKENGINGIAEVATKYGVQVYPNPAKEQVVVSANQSMNGLKVFSLDGQIVYQENRKAEIYTIPAQQLASGFYLVSFEINGQLVVQKLAVK